MSGNVFGSRIRSSVSTFAIVALMAAAPALVAGSASAATVDLGTPSASTSSATTAPAAPKAEQKADATKAATKTEVQPQTHQTQAQTATPAKPAQVQVATTPKVEVTKTQAEAVAKELGAKPTDALTVQLGKYHEQIQAANALKDKAARDKAVTEAHQQLTAIGGKPVTPEQAGKIDGILGVKAAPSAIQ